MFIEILSCEQPCVLCGQALEAVTLHRDDVTGEERVERSPLPHTEADCRRMIGLYREIWPAKAW